MNTVNLWSRSCLVALLLAGPPVLAEDRSATPDKQPWCQENPKQCEERKAKREAWCQANPGPCEKARARHAEMRKQCEADPAACEKKREEMKQRRQQRREAGADGAPPIP